MGKYEIQIIQNTLYLVSFTKPQDVLKDNRSSVKTQHTFSPSLNSYMFRIEQSIIWLIQDLITVQCSHMSNIQYIILFNVGSHIT